MAEEHEFQSPEGRHRLCVNNCGFFGSPATQNMCSKCYHDLTIDKSDHDSNSNSLFSPLAPLNVAPSTTPPSSLGRVELDATSSTGKAGTVAVATTAAHEPMAGRCSNCRKKVGLTGFRCRCGVTFCGAHRYPEKHGCMFDFKAMGREAIAKANPVVKGEKLHKI